MTAKLTDCLYQKVVTYILNNFGIRYIGASLTALISASAPALTALFARISLQEALQPPQILGIGLVTVGVAALSLNRRSQK
ncbi:MAG: DMT family transporter [Phormidesmis sp.]